jgi:hypothetical protein
MPQKCKNKKHLKTTRGIFQVVTARHPSEEPRPEVPTKEEGDGKLGLQKIKRTPEK